MHAHGVQTPGIEHVLARRECVKFAEIEQLIAADPMAALAYRPSRTDVAVGFSPVYIRGIHKDRRGRWAFTQVKRRVTTGGFDSNHPTAVTHEWVDDRGTFDCRQVITAAEVDQIIADREAERAKTRERTVAFERVAGRVRAHGHRAVVIDDGIVVDVGWLDGVLSAVTAAHDLGDFAWCETAAASGMRHVRRISEKGRKTSGGCDTPALCGVTPAWDVDGAVTLHAQLTHATRPCDACMTVLREAMR